MINKHIMKKLGQLAEITKQAAMTRLSRLTSQRAGLENEIAEIKRAIAKPADTHRTVASEVYEKWVVWGERRSVDLNQQIKELQPFIAEAQREARTALGRSSVIDKLRQRHQESIEKRALIQEEQLE
ncbi:MAG: hypothetical protein GXP05_11880 [Alphaproteobacteria bacterium]|nr:hypothetical protein [Alphaproteobacteria bacterium]